jgi:uncharacterized protein DUF4339
MYWYYEKGGSQVGPLTEEQFQKVLHAGEVRADTLVWNESLSGWVAYKTLSTPLPTAVNPNTHYCSQCSRSFNSQDMIQYTGLWICADCKGAFFQRLKEGGKSGGAWRDGTLMVASKGAMLPDRCVKCNTPANGLKLTRKLYWHPPAYYLLICAGVLIYAIVAVIVRKTTTIDFGICLLHKNQRTRNLTIAWSLLGVSIALFIIGIAADEGAIAGIGLPVFLIALIFAIVAAQFVTPRKMNPDGLVWLKGVNPEYLEQLPPYTA